MASDTAEPVWQPSTDAQALAQLRSLIRAYIRGELSHSAFVLQFGVMSLTHDVATPRPPDVFLVPEEECDRGHCPSGEHDGVSCHLCNSHEPEECVFPGPVAAAPPECGCTGEEWCVVCGEL